MIKVLFFGSVAAKLGQRECVLDAGEPMRIADVVALVGCGDFKPLLVAVNQEQVNDMNMIVKDGDEVALMPPFSGG